MAAATSAPAKRTGRAGAGTRAGKHAHDQDEHAEEAQQVCGGLHSTASRPKAACQAASNRCGGKRHRRGLTREALIAALAHRAAEPLQAALQAMFAVADEHLELLAGMFLARGEMFHKPGPEALTVDAFADPLERLLRDSAVDGSLRPVDPTPTATVLFNTAGWGYVHLRASHRWPPDRARAAVIDLVLGGLLPR